MVKNLDEESGEQFKTIIIGGKKVKVPVLFVLPEEYGEKEIETYEHPEVNIGKAAESEEEPLDKLTDGKLEEVEKEPQPSHQNIHDEGQAILDEKVPDTKIGAPPKKNQISLDTAIANKINALAIQVKVNRLVAKKDDWDDKESDKDKKYVKGDKGEESGLYDELENPKDLKNIDDESLEYGKRVGVRPNSWGGTKFDVETDKKTGKPVKVTPSRVVGTDPDNSNPNSALANDARYSDGSEAQNISQRNADKWKAAVEALKDAIKPSKGQLKEGNKPKEYDYEQAPSFEIGGKNTDTYEYSKAPDNEFQRQSTGERGREMDDSTLYGDGLEKLVGAQNVGVLTHPSDRDTKVRQKVPKHIADAEKSWRSWLAKKEEEQTTFDDEENVDPLHAEAKKKKKEVWDKARRDGIGMTWDSQGKKIQ